MGIALRQNGHFCKQNVKSALTLRTVKVAHTNTGVKNMLIEDFNIRYLKRMIYFILDILEIVCVKQRLAELVKLFFIISLFH